MVAEKVFAVIAESTRRDILDALARESKAVGQLVDELGVSQPTVSKHLRVLREAGVVTMRAQGQKRFYGINTEPLTLVSAWLESLGAGAAAVAAVAAAAAQPAPGQRVASLSVVRDEPANGPESGRRPAAAATDGQPMRAATTSPANALVQAEPVPVAATAQAGGAAAASSGSRAVPAPAATLEKVAPAAAPGPVPVGVSAPAASQPVASVPAASKQMATIVQSNENDGGVQGQISRSVGRAANKAVDLLANLPTLPTFRRRKD